ncbi:putative ferric-chelate reductase 1 [Anableps anableps]
MERTMIQVIATMAVFLTLGFQPGLSQVDITRTGCGTTKFCLEKPTNCNPADNNTGCLFGSARPTAVNIDLAFELSGNSSGYIALGLTQNPTGAGPILFVCAQNRSNSGSFFFTTMTYNSTNTENITLESASTNVTGIKSSVDGENIKCTFNVANLNASAAATTNRAAADTTFVIVIGSGELNGDGLGVFRIAESVSIDLATFLPNSTANTTAAPSGASRPLHSNAVLPLLSFLTLSILKFA